MLQVTEKARTILEWVRTDQKLPESLGIRISTQPDGELSLDWAEDPEEGDEVIRQLGTEIYVASHLVEQLSESVIDLEETPQGPDLTVRPRAPDETVRVPDGSAVTADAEGAVVERDDGDDEPDGPAAVPGVGPGG